MHGHGLQSCLQMSFLRMRETTPVSVADITATVEEVAGKVSSVFKIHMSAACTERRLTAACGQGCNHL